MSVRVAVAGHEIGHHGWTHMTPVTMSRDEEEAGLQRGTDAIVKLCGLKPRGYRSPAWDLSENTVDLLVSRGFLYESSMMGNDYTPYFARTGDVIALEEPMQFGPETSLVEMPISWTLDDYPHFEFVQQRSAISIQGLMPAGGVLQNWVDDFDYMTRTMEWGVLTYTCHPLRDRPRPPHDDAGAADRGAAGAGRGLHDHGGRRERLAGAHRALRLTRGSSRPPSRRSSRRSPADCR